MEYSNHGFFPSKEITHNWFIDLSNPFKVVVHYFLIGGITCLNYQDGFP